MIRLADHLPADPKTLAASLTPTIREMQGSLILQIAAEVRALVAKGQPVCNLTVGDFDARQFPVPTKLRDETVAAFEGHTNYPPSEGIPELRKSISGFYERHLGLDVPPEWIIVASGARPVMYATFRMFLNPGDELLFCLPSWNNGYYAQMNQAVAKTITTLPENDFFPTPEQLVGPLKTAKVFSLNSPLNPTGTVISAAQLEGVARAVVAENARRAAEGRAPVVWMWDQVYWQLTYPGGSTAGDAKHVHPCTLVPEVAPYVITVDAISKAFAATGLRVGWGVLPPIYADRMKALIGHVGAWAPRPEQVATAKLLDDDAAVAAFEATFKAGLHERLHLLHSGLADLGVEHKVPQGAMYLSVRFDLFGRPGADGAPMKTNEDVRKFLLQKAGVAVVPFQAFDLPDESGWFRMSVGAVSVADLKGALERLAKVI